MRHLWLITVSLIFACSILSLTAASSSQSPPGQSGKIKGTIKDPSGVVITDAKVTLRNETTGETRNVDTDKEGRFTIEELAPGQYIISVTCPGFKIAERNITIEGGRTETIEFKLDIRDVPGPVVIQSQAPEQPIKLTIKAAKDEVRSGDPIEIAITMQNISDHDIKFILASGGRDMRAELDFKIIVRDKNGEILDETRYKKGINHGIAGSQPTLILSPGEERIEKSNLNKLYDLSMPGEYNVQVEKQSPHSEDIMVQSNTIKITVTY